jgi:hypothetical protein
MTLKEKRNKEVSHPSLDKVAYGCFYCHKNILANKPFLGLWRNTNSFLSFCDKNCYDRYKEYQTRIEVAYNL